MECIFCQIAQHETETKILYEDDDIVAFPDIYPKAPHHLLIIPKRHTATLNDLQSSDAEMVGKMVLVAKKLAKELGVAEKGYRLLFNCNRDAGQVVFHIHLHLLGGRPMHWPPG
jgi:histidine triad (HIT) family protein